MPVRAFGSILFLICAAFSATANHNDRDYTLLARSAGPLRSVAVSSDHAFAGVGHQLWVFDITDKENPALVFESEALPTPIEKIAVKNDYAYVAAGKAGLFIYEISAPSSPNLISSLNTAGSAIDIAVSSLDAYLSSQRAGLRSVHILDPFDPVEHLPRYRRPYSVVGVATGLGGFVAETTSPSGVVAAYHIHVAQPKILPNGVIPVRGTAQGLAVRDEIAYIAAGNAGLQIVDVSRTYVPPTHQEIGFSKKSGLEDAFDATLDGSLAFVADRTVTDFDDYYRPGGMRIVDITNPAAPTELSNVKGDVWSIAVESSHAIVADYTRGRTRNRTSLDIVDVSDPAQPSRSASFSIPPEIDAPMAANGTDIYTVDDHLRRFDLSDPAHPHLAWSLALPRDTYFRGTLPGLAITLTHAYVGGGSAGLHIVNISDPDQPQFVTTLNVEAYDVVVENSRVYASELFGGIGIIDIAIPATPSIVGTIKGNFSVGDMEVQNDVLYVAPYPGASLILYGVPNSAMPMLRGYFSVGDDIHQVEVEGDYAYLAVGATDARIVVVDISEPTDSHFVSEFDAPWPRISDMALAGDSLYVTIPAKPGGGLRTVNVSNPNNPRVRGKFTMRSEFANAVVVLPEQVVALGGSAGLVVLQESDTANP